MWQSVAVVGQDNQLLHDTKQEAMAASNRATENVENGCTGGHVDASLYANEVSCWLPFKVQTFDSLSIGTPQSSISLLVRPLGRHNFLKEFQPKTFCAQVNSTLSDDSRTRWPHANAPGSTCWIYYGPLVNSLPNCCAV
jgi:hypothetical protein